MADINISLSANTAQYVKRLKDAKTETDRNIIKMEQRMDAFANQMASDFSSVDGALNAMVEGLRGLQGGGYIAAFGALALGVGSVAAGFHNLAKEALTNETALKNAAMYANMSTEEFKVLALTVGTVGIGMEEYGQISKDVMDRIGDYATSGGGALQDFFDVVGEGKVKFEDIKDLDAPDFLQAIVTEMEKAGASGNQMVFALESISSEASVLLPLLVNNGEKMKLMQQRMQEIAQTPLMNPDTIVEMKVLEANWGTMWDTMGVVASNKLTGLYEMMNGLLLKVNEFLVSMNTSDVASTIREDLTKGKGYSVDASKTTSALKIEQAAIKQILDENNDSIASLERRIAGYKKNTTNYSRNQLVRAQAQLAQYERQNQALKTQESILASTIKKNEEAELKQLDEAKRKPSQFGSTVTPSNTSPSQFYDANTSKAAIDVAPDEMARIAAIEAARIDEINQMKIHENMKLKLIEKAGEDRKNAELKHLQDVELKKAQLRVDSAITEQERLDADHALAQAKLNQRFENELIGIAAQNAMKFNLAYEHEQEKNALDAERIADADERKIAEAKANLDFLDAQLAAEHITQKQYDALGLEHQMAITEAKRNIQMKELDMTSQMFGALGGLMKEGSKAQRAMLVAEKSATIAKLGMQMWDAWGAVDDDPTLITQGAKLAAKAGVLAQYGGAIAQVTSTAIGQAHDGMDEIDQTGSYILKQGERVIQPTANKDLTAYLKENNSNAKQAMEIKSDLIIQGDTTISDEKFQAMLGQHRESLAAFVRLAQRENPSL